MIFTKEVFILRNKGITLVALVITIIILLILAAISINLLMSSGFISKSKYAIEKHKIEQAKEALTIALSTTLADDNSALKSDSFEDKLNKNVKYKQTYPMMRVLFLYMIHIFGRLIKIQEKSLIFHRPILNILVMERY